MLAGIATVDVVGGDAPHQLGWVALVAGAALLPDLDMPRSTVGRMWGPVTRGLWHLPGASHLVKALAGGHRAGTHSIIGITATMGLLWVASLGALSSAVIVAICTGMVILAVDFWVKGRMHWGTNLLVSVCAGGAAHTSGWSLPWWLPLAIGAGMIVHCFGDEITKQRVPWAWPFHAPRSELGESWWRIRTNGPAERWLFRAILVGIVVLLMMRTDSL